jgi:hypothetical protein
MPRVMKRHMLLNLCNSSIRWPAVIILLTSN